MHLPPLILLMCWIPVSGYLFYRYPIRVASLANFLGGWALLPGANYRPSPEAFPYWILSVSLPAGYFVTKATVVGFTGLLGTLFFDFPRVRRFRLALCDIPVILWCCVPLLSAVTHWGTLHEGLRGSVYHTIAWGAPYLLGRIYFSDFDSLLLAAKACIIAGICYVPICLVEVYLGPQLYAFVYGYQPFRWVGAERYVGFRPIGFLEDGNQLGIWMATAALISIALYARRLVKRILGLPISWIAAGLTATTLLCQSVGSVVLLLFLIPLVSARRRSYLRIVGAVLVFSILAFVTFQITNPVSLRRLAQRNGAIDSIASGLRQIGRHSLAWRLARDESDIAVVLQHPVLGSGEWNWWQKLNSRPWDLCLLVTGMYGLIGLIAFEGLQLLPVIRTLLLPANDRSPEVLHLQFAFLGLILMTALDNFFNSAMILPYLLIIGGLSTPSRQCALPSAISTHPDSNR